MSTQKRTHPSADRNSKPILEAMLKRVDAITPGLKMLEIASGSGQHVGYIAPHFPNITFQPTEYDTEHFDSIKAYAAECVTGNILPPVFVDISQDMKQWTNQFQPASFDYIFNSNMIHITPFACTEGLFRAAGVLLKKNGVLLTYGPYAVNGVLKPESNIEFDKHLRERNPEWGVRDIAVLSRLSAENSIALQIAQDMPSNNKFISWIKM
ncbi:UPF0585 protein CG18661 isoform X2 [Teleopsis dalmanni]|uniref:UPF0585 protein CG18661 isoform X2 n=1 Tax=Teleopsis dalmanni TaxID=139649 RepID=UPI0018CDC1DE|nr:UPF0585 protein CG18661 isoform X2 [Teleopsis dalmanni]